MILSEFKFLTKADIFEIFLKYPIFKKDENFSKIIVKCPNGYLDSVVEFRHNNIFIYTIYEKDNGRFLEEIIHFKASNLYGGYMITESYIDSIAQFIVKQLKEIEIKNKKLNIEQDF